MCIEKFKSFVLPPKDPEELPDAQIWNHIEVNVGKLPDDYKSFIQHYGTGCIDSFIWIFNPASSNPNLNFGHQVNVQTETLREINEEGVERPIPLFPSDHGLLPFGITDNGDVLFWETNEDPNGWTVAVIEARSSPLQKFEMNMTSFLAGICERSISCDAFPDDFPSVNPTFSTMSQVHS
jgi:hypothetical protein